MRGAGGVALLRHIIPGDILGRHEKGDGLLLRKDGIVPEMHRRRGGVVGKRIAIDAMAEEGHNISGRDAIEEGGRNLNIIVCCVDGVTKFPGSQPVH